MTPPLSALFISLGLVLFISSFVIPAQAATLADWKTRSIYQVLTDRFATLDATPSPCAVENGLYCGGNWQGIGANLDYIQGMGFDAIWISPVVAQLPQQTGDGEAYAGYWGQDLYALNPRFGNAKDLHNLIAAVHDRGMYLMLDIVVNHMGYAGTGWSVDYSIFNPFNDQKYFHDYCEITEPSNQTDVEVCWLGDTLVALADLRTEDPDVQGMFGDWISQMVANYSIDGLRIDTSINVEPGFFPDFVNASGVFATGEVMQGDDSLACEWADTIGSILNYPIYYPLTRAFQSSEGSIGDLVETINSVKANCQDPTAFGSFSEDADVPRFASYTDDMSLAKNIITYNFMTDGIPIIFQGQEQHMNGGITPAYMNRAPLWEVGYNTSATLYQHIVTLNTFRQHVISSSTNYTDYLNEVIYQDMHSIGMRKGFNGSQVITLVNNNGVSAAYFELPITGHDYNPGTELMEVLTCINLTVNETGYLNVPMFAGTPKILYPTALLYNSSLCGMAAEYPAGSATTISTSVPTTVNGHETTVPKITVSPLPVTATSAPEASSSHRALGVGDTMMPSIPMVLSAAMIATVASAGYLTPAQIIDV